MDCTFVRKLALSTLITFCTIWRLAAAEPSKNFAPFFLGQHILYNGSYLGLDGNLFEGLRIWGAQGTTWAAIEPVKGRFDFGKFDQHVAAAEGLQLNLIHTLGQTPQWASSRPSEQGNTGMGAASEPQNIQDWALYVRTVVQRYRGRISAYEVMNEPRIPEAIKPWSPGFFSGSAEKLAEMTRVAAMEIRMADPAAKVVCPSMDGEDGLKRLDYFLSTGAGEHCDVIGFHYYLRTYSITDLRSMIGQTRSILVRHGLGHLPIWNTETGVLISDAGYGLKPIDKVGPLSRMFQSDDAARFATQVLVVSHSLGIERNYWFAHDSSWMGSTTADKRQNQLNPFGKSLALVNSWLNGRFLKQCIQSGTGFECEVHDAQDRIGNIYWGNGKTSEEWARQGFTSVQYLNGKRADLAQLDPTMQIPFTTNDVIFLSRTILANRASARTRR